MGLQGRVIGGTAVFVKSSISLVGELETVGWPGGQSQSGCKARTQLVALIQPGLLAGKEPDCTS